MNTLMLLVVPILGIVAGAPQQEQARLHDNDPLSLACLGKHGSLLPVPGSCTDFVICRAGMAVPSSCGEFYRFNAQLGFCDHPQNVACPAEDWQLPQIEDPNTYSDYPLNMLADEAIVRLPVLPFPKPISPEEVNYDAAAGAICVGQLDGVQFPKSQDCEHFYVCIQQRPYRRSCAADLHFNAASSECQVPAEAKCAWYQPKMKTNLASLICVNAPHGSLVPHNADCGKFFYCDHAEPLEMKCPKGLHFSAKSHVCVWPQQASCIKLYRQS